MPRPVAGSSNGRTPDSGSGSQGSSPCPAASQSPLPKRAFAFPGLSRRATRKRVATRLQPAIAARSRKGCQRPTLLLWLTTHVPPTGIQRSFFCTPTSTWICTSCSRSGRKLRRELSRARRELPSVEFGVHPRCTSGVRGASKPDALAAAASWRPRSRREQRWRTRTRAG
jgi:hypothetical protein